MKAFCDVIIVALIFEGFNVPLIFRSVKIDLKEVSVIFFWSIRGLSLYCTFMYIYVHGALGIYILY